MQSLFHCTHTDYQKCVLFNTHAVRVVHLQFVFICQILYFIFDFFDMMKVSYKWCPLRGCSCNVGSLQVCSYLCNRHLHQCVQVLLFCWVTKLSLKHRNWLILYHFQNGMEKPLAQIFPTRGHTVQWVLQYVADQLRPAATLWNPSS